MIPSEPPRSLRLRIDREAIAANWRALDRLSGTAAAGAAVKADCYGVGIEQAVPALLEAGARDFLVAHWSEAARLLALVPPQQISVLHGPLTATDAAWANAAGVRPVINSITQARMWLDVGGGPCDLMVDTGINRLGLPLADLGDEAIARLEIDVLMSHLASADEDSPLNAAQLDRFNAVEGQVEALRRSLSNSAGIALGQNYAFDLTRPGLSLYGGVPRPELEGTIRQVVFPEAVVLQLRSLSPGEGVGYNSAFVADRPMHTATVSLGYADGFLRCWGEKGWLEHNGSRLPLLGKVSMDMVVVDCSTATGLREGDWLTLPYDLSQASALSGLSQYELLTILGHRFSR